MQKETEKETKTVLPLVPSSFTRLTARYNTRYYAIAASLLLAVGISAALIDFPDSSVNPTTAELALGEEILAHLYIDSDEIDAINLGGDLGAIAMPAVNEVMANAGTQLLSNAFMQNLPVRSAKPCIILPAFQSAHLLVMGDQGAVSIIVINNSPVSGEYSFRDDRFVGIVVPMEAGNMILVGERSEDLDQLKALFSENLEWVI